MTLSRWRFLVRSLNSPFPFLYRDFKNTPGFNPYIARGRESLTGTGLDGSSRVKTEEYNFPVNVCFVLFFYSDQEQTLEISTPISQEKIRNWRRRTKTSLQTLTRTNSRTSLSSTHNSWAIALFNSSFNFTLYIDNMDRKRWRKFEILFQNETNFIFLERDRATVYFLDFKWPWSLRIKVVIVAWFITGCGTRRDC